eukprot:8219726-Pyramimonas_sp.AAC.1
MQTGDVDCSIDAEDFMRSKFAVYDIKKEVIDQFDKFSPMARMDYHWGRKLGPRLRSTKSIHSIVLASSISRR